jgi:hypothetical protein
VPSLLRLGGSRSTGTIESHVRIVGILLLITAGWVVGAASAVGPARFVRFSEVRPMLTELAGRLPPDLNTLTPAQMETAWPRWIERHDGEIRARLEQGDEDTIINWTLFGTTFTSKPRAILGAVESGTTGDRELVVRRTIELVSARVDDLLTALATPAATSAGCSLAPFFREEGFASRPPPIGKLHECTCVPRSSASQANRT